MQRNRKRTTETSTPRNTRAEARRLFPQWDRTTQARWVLARLRTRSGTWRFPTALISINHVDTSAPDFLRSLPRGEPLAVAHDLRDHLQHGVRYLKRLVK